MDDACACIAAAVLGRIPGPPSLHPAAGTHRRPLPGLQRRHLQQVRDRLVLGHLGQGAGDRGDHRSHTVRRRGRPDSRSHRTSAALRLEPAGHDGRRLHHDHGPGSHPLHPSGSRAAGRALYRKHRHRADRHQPGRAVHRHAGPLGAGDRAGLRRLRGRRDGRRGRHPRDAVRRAGRLPAADRGDRVPRDPGRRPRLLVAQPLPAPRDPGHMARSISNGSSRSTTQRCTPCGKGSS